jgi:hypothetical protein
MAARKKAPEPDSGIAEVADVYRITWRLSARQSYEGARDKDWFVEDRKTGKFYGPYGGFMESKAEAVKLKPGSGNPFGED